MLDEIQSTDQINKD